MPLQNLCKKTNKQQKHNPETRLLICQLFIALPCWNKRHRIVSRSYRMSAIICKNRFSLLQGLSLVLLVLLEVVPGTLGS